MTVPYFPVFSSHISRPVFRPVFFDYFYRQAIRNKRLNSCFTKLPV